MKNYEVVYDRDGTPIDRVAIARNLLMMGVLDPERTPAFLGISRADLQELQRDLQQNPPKQEELPAAKPKSKPHLRLL